MDYPDWSSVRALLNIEEDPAAAGDAAGTSAGPNGSLTPFLGEVNRKLLDPPKRKSLLESYFISHLEFQPVYMMPEPSPPVSRSSTPEPDLDDRSPTHDAFGHYHERPRHRRQTLSQTSELGKRRRLSESEFLLNQHDIAALKQRGSGSPFTRRSVQASPLRKQAKSPRRLLLRNKQSAHRRALRLDAPLHHSFPSSLYPAHAKNAGRVYKPELGRRPSTYRGLGPNPYLNGGPCLRSRPPTESIITTVE